jgi:hypothetical protein
MNITLTAIQNKVRTIQSSVFLDAMQTACCLMVSCLPSSSKLNMEATRVSKTSVDFEWTLWHYVTGEMNLYEHHCENLKSFTAIRLCFSSCTGVPETNTVITDSITLYFQYIYMTDSAASGNWETYHMTSEHMHIANLSLNNLTKIWRILWILFFWLEESSRCLDTG